MAAIADLSDLTNRLTGGNGGNPQHVFQVLSGRSNGASPAAPVTGFPYSLWRFDKTDGSTGAVPGVATACNKSTPGAMVFSNPASGRQQWLLGFEGIMNTYGGIMLYDRLLHCGGLSGTLTTPQIVGGTLTRYNTNATCVGNMIWAEIYSNIGSTSVSFTATYTNQDGIPGRVTKAAVIGGVRNTQGCVLPLALADGDTGVLAVSSVTLSASTGTAGNFGITIARPLGFCGTATANSYFGRDFIAGLPSEIEILPDACLAWLWFAATATVPSGILAAHMVEA